MTADENDRRTAEEPCGNAPSLSPQDYEAGRRLFARGGRFLLSAAQPMQLPRDGRPEVCFCGRSNTGKSSLLNALMGQKTLARTSKTPGRTRLINLFEDGAAQIYLADLPGYGYAAVSRQTRSLWEALLAAYLRDRARLVRAFVLIDSRRGLRDTDEALIALLGRFGIVFQIVLTKTDKVAAAELETLCRSLRAALETVAVFFPPIVATSAVASAGLADLRAHIARLLPHAGAGTGPK